MGRGRGGMPTAAGLVEVSSILVQQRCWIHWGTRHLAPLSRRLTGVGLSDDCVRMQMQRLRQSTSTPKRPQVDPWARLEPIASWIGVCLSINDEKLGREFLSWSVPSSWTCSSVL